MQTPAPAHTRIVPGTACVVSAFNTIANAKNYLLATSVLRKKRPTTGAWNFTFNVISSRLHKYVRKILLGPDPGLDLQCV